TGRWAWAIYPDFPHVWGLPLPSPSDHCPFPSGLSPKFGHLVPLSTISRIPAADLHADPAHHDGDGATPRLASKKRCRTITLSTHSSTARFPKPRPPPPMPDRPFCRMMPL